MMMPVAPSGDCARSAAPRAWASTVPWCENGCSADRSLASWSIVGVGTGPPKVDEAAKPTSSVRMSRTFGAPSGARPPWATRSDRNPPPSGRSCRPSGTAVSEDGSGRATHPTRRGLPRYFRGTRRGATGLVARRQQCGGRRAPDAEDGQPVHCLSARQSADAFLDDRLNTVIVLALLGEQSGSSRPGRRPVRLLDWVTGNHAHVEFDVIRSPQRD